MPNPCTFPTLFDEVPQLCITSLKKRGLLQPDQMEGITIDNTFVFVNMMDFHPYVDLLYKYRGKHRNHKIYLESTPSNLGRGRIWYFLCPRIHKRCRKLYFIGGLFLHREAFSECMYSCQTKSKWLRGTEKVFYAVIFLADQLNDQLKRKHFKRTYAGKPTKRYQSIQREYSRIEQITLGDIDKISAQL